MASVRNLGPIDGPLLVFGGPYSNLQATRGHCQSKILNT